MKVKSVIVRKGSQKLGREQQNTMVVHSAKAEFCNPTITFIFLRHCSLLGAGITFYQGAVSNFLLNPKENISFTLDWTNFFFLGLYSALESKNYTHKTH